MMPGRKNREKGFTLVEMILIVLIGGLALVPILTLFANNASKSSDGQFLTVAGFLAAEKLDQVVADKMAPERGFSYIVSGNYPAESPVSGFAGYARTVTISPDSVYDGVTFRSVKVTVTRNGYPDVSTSTWFINY